MGVESPLFLYAAPAFLILLIIFSVVWEYMPIKRSFGRFYDSIGPLVRVVLSRYLFAGIGIVGILLALSGPYIVGSKSTSTASTFDLILLMDSSISMTGRVASNTPSRLERTQIITRDIVNQFPQADIAVCEFTNKIFCRAPFGSSRDVVLRTIDTLKPDANTGSGSRITEALNSMPREFSLSASEISGGELTLVLLSDGGDSFTSAYLWNELDEVLENLSDYQIHVIAIGVGEYEPIPIALKPTRSVWGQGAQEYEVVFSALDEEKMKRIALKTDGTYIHEDELEEQGLSFLSSFLSSTGAIKPEVISIAWIPGVISLAGFCSYLFFFWKNP